MTTTSESSSPIRSTNRPTPALVPWIHRSRSLEARVGSELERAEVEEDLRGVEQRFPLLSRAVGVERRERVVGRVARACDEVIGVGDLDPLVDGPDPLDEIGLERRRHDEPAGAGHPRTASSFGGSVKRPASEPPSTWSTAPVMCPAAGEQRKSTAFAMS